MRAALLAGLCLLPLLPQPAAADETTPLPDIGDAGMSTLSPAQEKQLGLEFMRRARLSLDLLDDPIASQYIQQLADRLISHYRYTDQTMSLFIVNDPSINAFAGPGGYIGVHTGLIMTANTEAELASVIAHEIAHVVQRHLVRRFEASSKLGLPTLGAILAAILIGSSNPEASEAIMATAMASNAQQQLTYSRGNEQEADRIGLELLTKANFDPRAMPEFFEALQMKQRIGESSTPEYFRTHPLTTSRIADTRNRSEQYPRLAYTEDINFLLVKARIAALDPRSLSQSTFAQRVNAGEITGDGARYFQTVMALKDNDIAAARQSIAQLIKADPLRVIYYYTAAEIELAAAQPQNAITQLETVLRLFPGNQPLTEIQARSLLLLNRPAAALQALRAILPQSDGSERIYQLYSQAADRSGERGEGYRALAESAYAHGDIRLAIDYYEQALKTDAISERERLAYQARLDALKDEAKAAGGQDKP